MRVWLILSHTLVFFVRLFPAAAAGFLFVKGRIKGIEVFRVEMILNDPQGLAEPLEVDDLPLTKEADRIADLGILYQTENVVVG